MNTIYMFPGQGSQKLGMGKELFDKFPDLVQLSNSILGFSIIDLCMQGPLDKLNQTQYTQPALFTINALSYLADIDTKKQLPDYLIGHSLGEYNALYAAGVFSFKTGLLLVQKRAQLMSQTNNGKMAAVLGLNREKIMQILTANKLNDLVMANYNSPEQIVISGVADQLDSAEAIFMQAGAKAVLSLPVSGAFHSPLMQNAYESFKIFLSEHEFFPAKIEVISNVTAQPYQIENIKELLAQQLIKPVEWEASISYLLKNDEEAEFFEIGPGSVLTKLLANIKDSCKLNKI